MQPPLRRVNVRVHSISGLGVCHGKAITLRLVFAPRFLSVILNVDVSADSPPTVPSAPPIRYHALPDVRKGGIYSLLEKTTYRIQNSYGPRYTYPDLYKGSAGSKVSNQCIARRMSTVASWLHSTSTANLCGPLSFHTERTLGDSTPARMERAATTRVQCPWCVIVPLHRRIA